MNRRYLEIYFLIIFLFISALGISCTGPSSDQEQSKQSGTSEQTDPIQAKIKERGEMMTQQLARQKEIKASIKQMPLIEQFKRETGENEVLSKLGKPENIKELTLENTQQRIFFYNKSNFAVWFWRKNANKGPYEYRATVSLNDKGKFDMPLHNVLEEGEIMQMRNALEPKE